MAGLPFQVAVLLALFHLVFSQQCPGGTPNGCQCQNRVFNCSGLGLSNMPASLSSLTDFDVIDLSNNNFGIVPTGAFRNLTSVQRIILMNSGITEIRPGGFDNLAQLTTINLKQNSLFTLEQTGFNLVNNLNELYLDSNPVACDDADNAWLKGWMTSVSNSVLTGNCASSGTIADALGLVIPPSTAVLSFEEAQFNALEGNEKAVITVTRTDVSTTRVEFDLTASDGTALLNEDFMPPLNSKHIMLEGQTRVDINILLNDDELREADETFTVTITIQSRGESANMATIGTYATATVTIRDNDGPTTMPPIATTSNPEPSTEPSTESNAERTDRNMTTDDTNQTLAPSTNSVNVAAIVVPIVLIVVIVAVIIGYLWYRRSRTVTKGTTAGV